MSETTSPRPNSPEGRDVASIIHPLTNLKAHLEKGPVVVEEGDGIWVTDIHGKKYIEGMSGLWCLSLGYGQERLVQAAAEQMRGCNACPTGWLRRWCCRDRPGGGR